MLARSLVAALIMNAGALAGTAAVILPVAAAHAQVRMGGPGGMGGPEISRRSLEQYARILKLDSAQKEAANHLLEAYTDATRRATDEMQEAMKAAREDVADGDFSELGSRLPKIMGEMGKKRAAAQQSFLSDLRQMLTPAQESAWPALERLRRREGHLGFGMVSGAGVDMTTVVDSLKLDAAESGKLADTLAQYEQDMDRLLVEREKAAEGRSEPTEFNLDMEKMKARMDEERAQGLKVRDLNKQYERRLASMLDDASRAKFLAEVRKRSFRQIYREPYVSKMLGAASKFDDLDPAQKQQLADMKASYEKDLEDLNARWAAALEQAETEGKASALPFMGGGNESEELKAAKQARRDLDKKFTERVRTALNDKQRERLPKKDSGERSIRFGDGGEGGGAVFVQALDIDDGDGPQSDVQVIVAPGGGN